MAYTTIGMLIRQARKEKKGMTRQMLAKGICSAQMLYHIEKDQAESDPLMIDMLIQLLGKSPDKLERILQAEMYRFVRVRDLLEKFVLKGRKGLAEYILQCYPERTNVDKMYRYRMRASFFYHFDKDYDKALDSLYSAVYATLPGFAYDTIDSYLISTVEMENLLAIEKINIEKKPSSEKLIEKEHLRICMAYIDSHFTDDEEHAKIYAKCAWLSARIAYCEGNYMQAMMFCENGMEGLRRNTMIYFMLPLLEIMVQCEDQLGVISAFNKWRKHYDTLKFLWDFFPEKWHPAYEIFHNCYQKEYHLDYELIRDERKAKGMTQEEFAEGIYQNAASLSRFETGKKSPNRKTFENMIEKLGMDKGRYNGYVVTDSFEVMALRSRVDMLQMRRRYADAQEILTELKERLDMTVQENQMMVKFYETMLATRLGAITKQDALESMKQLLKGFMEYDKLVFNHVPMRNEVLIINSVCLVLSETGRKEEAERLFKGVLQRIRDSKIHIKYRYRSYGLLLNNYMCWFGEWNSAVEGLNYALACGKASGISLCLNNITKILEKDGAEDKVIDRWSEAIYYMSDLFYFDKEKELFGKYLREERKIMILD